MADELKHFGVLGMRWGHRNKHPGTQEIINRANKTLNNPNSSKKDVDSALESIGVNPKTGKKMTTKPVYDKSGNDISVNPVGRLGKKKGQSDKSFDAEIKAEDARDPDLNPTAANLARRKVEDLQIDQAARKQTIAMLATAGAILAAKYVVMHQINKVAKEAILKKYGPTLAQMIIESKGL